MTLPRRAFLGAELPPDEEAFTGEGVRIAGVLEDGMAVRAKLVAGDIVVAIAERPVRDFCELASALRAAGAARRVSVAFLRAGERLSRTVETVPAPRDPAFSYGELAVGGARVRTFATRVEQPRALVVIIQGIACESVEGSPLAALAEAWAASRYGCLAFDKRGIGDSEGGPCKSVDFSRELADARAVVTHAAASGVPTFLFGHSVGGVIAAQLAGLTAGVMVYGTPVMKWIDALVDSTRRQLALRGASESEIAERVKAIHHLTERGELDGRSAAYHAQLAAVDNEAAWRAVNVPVLVTRGEYDWVVDAHDQARVATLSRGTTKLVELRGLDHLLGWHADQAASLTSYGAGVPDDALATRTIAWLDEQVAR